MNEYATVITEKVNDLEKFIFDFHQAELLRDFDKKIIECQICLSTKLGKLCAYELKVIESYKDFR